VSDPDRTVEGMKIDCDTCVARGDACSDCVVSFLTVPVRGGLGSADARLAGARLVDATTTHVEVDAAQVRAMRALARGGLVAPLRHLA
jgi:hypothetical protein